MLPSASQPLEGITMLRTALSVVAVSVLALTMNTGLAQAQSRVFVAAQGSDSNACSFAAPCRTFQKAHDTVAAGGEINVLDPAGYGTVTINKAISIQGHDFSGISTPSGGAAITINANVNDKVILRGLIIEGGGVGASGIVFNSGMALTIDRCVVRNLTSSGIAIAPILAQNGVTKVAISDTL